MKLRMSDEEDKAWTIDGGGNPAAVAAIRS